MSLIPHQKRIYCAVYFRRTINVSQAPRNVKKEHPFTLFYTRACPGFNEQMKEFRRWLLWSTLLVYSLRNRLTVSKNKDPSCWLEKRNPVDEELSVSYHKNPNPCSVLPLYFKNKESFPVFSKKLKILETTQEWVHFADFVPRELIYTCLHVSRFCQYMTENRGECLYFRKEKET